VIDRNKNENKVHKDDCYESATKQEQDNKTEEYWDEDSGRDEKRDGGDALEDVIEQEIFTLLSKDNLTNDQKKWLLSL
jgi:hypothetical protein